jgi:hypothetical protein
MGHGDNASRVSVTYRTYHICNTGAMRRTRGTPVAASFRVRHLVSIRPRTLVAAIALGAVTVSGLVAAPHSAPFSSIRHTSHGEIAPSPIAEPVDFKGNEVRQAIARYKVDPTGALYEEHSPDTELPRLGSPKG